MKIYTYKSFPGTAKAVQRESAAAHRLGQHLEYLKRLRNYFGLYETDDPEEADYFFIPLLLIAFQFHKTVCDPWPFISKFPYLDEGRHILFASGDFGQRAKSQYESHAAGRAYPPTSISGSTSDLSFSRLSLLPILPSRILESCHIHWKKSRVWGLPTPIGLLKPPSRSCLQFQWSNGIPAASTKSHPWGQAIRPLRRNPCGVCRNFNGCGKAIW